MKSIFGIEYARGATARIIDGGPALAPGAVKQMFPNADWTTVIADPISVAECMADRFGENFKIQKKIYAATPFDNHILIGGDHSVNFGHFAALADRIPNEDLCLVYIDAHLDIHTPATSQAQASGAPHGTNVRALMGDGDARWLSLQSKLPALKPENIFYLGTRSYEPAEIEFVRDNKIFMRSADEINTPENLDHVIADIRRQLNDRPFVVSFDFDAIDPKYFKDVLVPEPNGISVDTARRLVHEFADAHSFEFVEYAPTGDLQSANIVRELVGIIVNQ